MRILAMTATFGCLKEAELRLPAAGPAVVQMGNGEGKSTWCAFLCVMLFGPGEDIARWMPADGTPPEGELVCEQQGLRLRLRRDSEGGAPMGRFSAIYDGTDTPVPGLNGENAGVFLAGVDSTLFGEAACVPSGAAEKLLLRGELPLAEASKFRAAAARLEYRRAELRKELPALEQQAQELRQGAAAAAKLVEERDTLERDIKVMEREKAVRLNRLADQDKQQAAVRRRNQREGERMLVEAESTLERLSGQRRMGTAEEMNEELEEIREDLYSRRRMLAVFAGVMGVLTVMGIALGLVPLITTGRSAVPLFFLLPVLATLWVLTGVFWLINRGDDLRDLQDKAELEAALSGAFLYEKEEQEAMEQRDKALQYLALLDEDAQRPAPAPPEADEEMEAALAKLAELNARIAEQGEAPAAGDSALNAAALRVQEVEETCAALSLALELLEETKAERLRRLTPELCALAGESLRALTGGRYENITMQDGVLTVCERGREFPAKELSPGTADQLAMCVQLAYAARQLHPDCPLVMDDALQRFDDARILMAYALLEEAAAERQVILFTSRAV